MEVFSILIPELIGCARCGDTHRDLVGHPFRNELPLMLSQGTVYKFTHWCPCPTNGEPILIAKDTFKKVDTISIVDYNKELFPE